MHLVFFALLTSLSFSQDHKLDPILDPGKLAVMSPLVAEERLIGRLKNDDLWFDYKKPNDLLGYLRVATSLNRPGAAPHLAANIAYPALDGRAMSTDRSFPAYGVLKALGMRSVKAILHELKSIDPENKPGLSREEIDQIKDDKQREAKLKEYLKEWSESTKLRHRANKEQMQILLLQCLVEIYEQGGFGVALARQRIELEIAKTSGKERERLLKALKHPALK